MTKLIVYLCSFPISGLNEAEKQDVISSVGVAFCKCYDVDGRGVTVKVDEAETPNWDIVIAYDVLPSVTDAMSSRLNRFRDTVANDLFRVLPSPLGYGGKVTVRDMRTIQNAANNVGHNRSNSENGSDDEEDMDVSYGKMAQQFQAEAPRFTFNQLVLDKDVKNRLLEALSVLENREKLFHEWNLKAIMSPSVLLNLYGDSGTGKTMTAEALADKLGKKIIRTTYADIESKYHGEGPKRLKAIFLAAKQQDAVLFIDEADSMLSSRLTNVSQGSEQAINSMRSQLLISLENHDGVVVFATNLIENYDKAFLTRLICLELKRPDKEARKKIWFNHLYPVGNDEKTLRIPLTDDVDTDILSDYEFCGRDIRNAVKQACITTVMKGKEAVDQTELVQACERTSSELESIHKATHQVQMGNVKPMTEDEKKNLIEHIAKTAKNETPINEIS